MLVEEELNIWRLEFKAPGEIMAIACCPAADADARSVGDK